MLPERKKARGDEDGLEERRDHRREHAGNHADDDVVRSPPHYREVRGTARDILFLSTSQVTVTDLDALDALARVFAHSLEPGDVVALRGELGAGKTTFVAACVRALLPDAEVASPTFTFWHRYGGVPSVEHLDLYRVESPGEAVELGLDDALASGGIVFVEWPDRLPGFVPAGAIAVTFEGSGDDPRTVTIERT